VAFPERQYDDAKSFADEYVADLIRATESVDSDRLEAAAATLAQAHKEGRRVYSCGNGGSAATANHLVCDHCKLVQTDTALTPRVHSLSSAVEIITAVANDLSYDDVFVYQLRSWARPGDVLVTISASGDSENVVRAATWAKENGLAVISLTGFAGGRSARIADVNLQVAAENYGVIEDVHQILIHILAQYIRQAHMDEETIAERLF
jgi:D-sedoheptulose 7-phosphate isomerase